MKQVIQAQVDEAKETLLTLDARIKERDRRNATDGASRTARIPRKPSKAKPPKSKPSTRPKRTPSIDWPTTSPFHKASLEDTVKFGEAELVRLSAVKTILGVDGGKAYRELWNAIQNGANAATVTAAIANARKPPACRPLSHAA